MKKESIKLDQKTEPTSFATKKECPTDWEELAELFMNCSIDAEESGHLDERYHDLVGVHWSQSAKESFKQAKANLSVIKDLVKELGPEEAMIQVLKSTNFLDPEI